VFGGSQGAVRLNQALVGAAADLAAASVAVLHAYGPKNSVAVDEPGYVAVPYLKRMDLAYAAADLVVCRSGAMTVAEISAVGLPAVYVPLPHGNGEQALNAAPAVAAGAALLIDDAAFTPDAVRTTVLPLATDATRLTAMSAAAAGLGHRDAAGTVAAAALALAARKGARR
jgi:UDP-N-acetylglucosamine--N-acetylmuramyl-(pentapeptide) pyrophosphoryl-undecaprenol N-acetylglucosamine transferase